MKMKLSRLLSILLCAVMVLGMMPSMTVHGAEPKTIEVKTYTHRGESEDGWNFYTVKTEEKTVEEPEDELALSARSSPKTVKTIVKDQYGDITFETFEDLKYLAGQHYNEYTTVVYVGPWDFVISEDLTIPENVELYFFDCAVTVAEGVTFTLADSCNFDTLTVNGTLAGNYINIEKSLTVTGSLICMAEVGVSSDCAISGLDKIIYDNEWCTLTVYYDVSDEASLQAGLKRAEKENGAHYFHFFTLTLPGDLVLTESATIPENSGIYIDKDYDLGGNPTLTLTKGATLTLNGYAVSCVNLVVNGKLSNNSVLDIIYDVGGRLTIGSGGSYTGNGSLYVSAYELDKPDAAVPGLDLDQFFVEKLSTGYWVLYNMKGLAQLPAPTEPQWGLRYSWEWDDEAGTWTQQASRIPGAMSWKSAVPNTNEYTVNLYRVTEGDAELVDQYVWYGGSVDASEWISINAFCSDPPESGTYYYEVKACGDFREYYDSEFAKSPTWSYTDPGVKLGACTDLSWNDREMVWSAPADSSLVGGYEVEIAYSPTENGTPSVIISGSHYLGADLSSAQLPNYIWREFGEGYYFFRVRALSSDITKAGNGDLSAFSPALHLSVPPTDVTRLAGADRFDTAFKVADQMKGTLGVEKFDCIVVASGAEFADALSGSYLAAVKNAPILLSYKQKQNEQVQAYIKANLAPGGTVYILGGTAAVPSSMEDGLTGLNVKRLAGENRFETNLLILKEAGVGDKEILVCTGTEFADSLSGSATGQPILLVYRNLTESQKEYLSGLKGNDFCIIGGENAVSESLEDAISAYGRVTRLAGENRLVTSVMVAQRYFGDPLTAVIAYGWNYPDGLCGGALAYSMEAPLILTYSKPSLYETAANYTNDIGIASGIVLGGEGLVYDEAVRAIFGMSASDSIAVK